MKPRFRFSGTLGEKTQTAASVTRGRDDFLFLWVFLEMEGRIGIKESRAECLYRWKTAQINVCVYKWQDDKPKQPVCVMVDLCVKRYKNH